MSKFVILHKKKDTLNRSCCIMKVTKQTLQHLRKKVPLVNTIHHSTFLYNQFKKSNLYKSFSNRVIGHLMSILNSIFISGYHGKTTDFAQNSSCHRTTIAHFLNSGKWDDTLLENTLKSSVVEIIYSEAQRTGKPVFCIVDDTIASKTKPSSRALHPIERRPASEERSPPLKFILIFLLLSSVKVFTILIKSSFVGIFFD